jgi:hypothetical protein
MRTEKILPVSHTGWDEGGGQYGDIQFYNAIFLEDFGHWKKGEKVGCLAILHSEGKVVEYSEDGHVVRSVNVKYVTVES